MDSSPAGSNPQMTTGYFKGRDGADLYYQSCGAGPALIGFNGLGCNSIFWHYTVSALSDRYQVIVWDYPGHGHSAKPLRYETLSIPELAAASIGLMDHLKISRAALMGHSMGVQVVLETAHRFTERVAGLMMICGAYGHPISHFLHTPLVKYFFPIPYLLGVTCPSIMGRWWHASMTGELSRPIARLIGIHPHLASDRDMDPYFEHMSRMEPQVFFRMAKYMQEHTAEPYLDTIQAPALIVAGMQDHFTPYWISLRMYERLPRSRLLTVPEGSHVSHIEMPRLVQRALLSFLTEEVYPPPRQP